MNYDHLLKKSDSISQAAERLCSILRVLRSPEGCPWDRSQTIDSFYKNLLEESYEYIDAVLEKDVHGCHEEIGDVMLVVCMLGLMHEERDQTGFHEMIDLTSEKLLRRHPHVFSDEQADNPDEVLKLWNAIKEDVEGKAPAADNFFQHVPKAMPPLDRAQKIQKKAAQVGFDWDTVHGAIEKLREEINELEAAAASQNAEDIEEEIGDLLFSMVNISRHCSVTASIALHKANEKFIKRFHAMSEKLIQQGKTLEDADLGEMDAAWDQAKNEA